MDMLIQLLIIALCSSMLFAGITLFMQWAGYRRWIHLLSGFSALLVGLGVLLYPPLVVIGVIALAMLQGVHTLLSYLTDKAERELSLLPNTFFPLL